MGAFNSRRNAGVEEIDYTASNAYRYPPKSGCYFGSYFIMGGERFDTTQPEAYLFGENQDLNFLGSRPVPLTCPIGQSIEARCEVENEDVVEATPTGDAPTTSECSTTLLPTKFPYPAPQANEPTKTLKSLVNIRKDSLRFIKVIDDSPSTKEPGEEEEEDLGEDGLPVYRPKYNIEFTFDTDVRVAITIYYFATEEISNGQAIYHPRDPTMNSETYHYKRGVNQTFSQSTHIIEPDKFPEEEWIFNQDKEVIPIVIQCVVEDEVEHAGHSHATFSVVEKTVDSTFVLKPLKQKQMVDGLCYLLQEIYGIENKNPERNKVTDEEFDDMGNECVICMSEIRDTLILPCRHLCLCNGCADSLRYQANNCPICRAPFRALLQIRAMRKKLANTTIQPASDSDDTGVSQENVPPGYEAVALIEALNGPVQPNTVSLPANGIQPVLPTGTSLPTSPEESPVLDKRKNKRTSSVRSRRSQLGAAVLEEGEEAREGAVTPVETGAMAADGDGQTTPEIKLLEEVPEPQKPGPAAAKPAATNIDLPDSETELEATPEFKPRSRKAKPKLYGRDSPVENMDVEAGATGETTEPSKDGPFEPHLSVTYEQEAGTDAAESEPLCTGGATALDAGSLPGTPASNTDGSSYSSTSSTRNLLPTVAVPGKTDTEEEKPEA